MNKILVTLQGRTLILYYQVRSGLERKGAGWANYIQVLPSAELERYNLKGLTPEMFCVNITDMINIRGMNCGQVENEKQLPVAKWELNYDEFLHLKSTVSSKLSHQQMVSLLSAMPAYAGTMDNQYIEFEERIVTRKDEEKTIYSGYRLTLMSEEIEGNLETHAYYYLDTCTDQGWQDVPPLAADHESIRKALEAKLEHIRETGILLTRIDDETDYAEDA